MGLPRSTNLVIAAIFLGVLDIIVVATRFFVRRRHGGFGLDDWLILPATLGAVGMSAITVTGVYWAGVGSHLKFNAHHIPVDPAIAVHFDKISFAMKIVSLFCLLFTKLSILSLYTRLFRGKIFTWVVRGLAVISFAWAISFFFATMFSCNPVRDAWDTVVPENRAHCIDADPMFYATAISNFIIDFAILLVPQPIIWRLQMPWQRRLGVSLICLLGAFIVAISIIRIAIFFTIEAGTDPTYNEAPALYWTQYEGNVTVICACLPVLAPVFSKMSNVFSNAYSSLFSSNGSRGNSKLGSKEQGSSMQSDSFNPNHSVGSDTLVGVGANNNNKTRGPVGMYSSTGGESVSRVMHSPPTDEEQEKFEHADDQIGVRTSWSVGRAV